MTSEKQKQEKLVPQKQKHEIPETTVRRRKEQVGEGKCERVRLCVVEEDENAGRVGPGVLLQISANCSHVLDGDEVVKRRSFQGQKGSARHHGSWMKELLARMPARTGNACSWFAILVALNYMSLDLVRLTVYKYAPTTRTPPKYVIITSWRFPNFSIRKLLHHLNHHY